MMTHDLATVVAQFIILSFIIRQIKHIIGTIIIRRLL